MTQLANNMKSQLAETRERVLSRVVCVCDECGVYRRNFSQDTLVAQVAGEEVIERMQSTSLPFAPPRT